MGIKNVTIEKLEGGLLRVQPQFDGVAGLVMGGMTTSEVALGEVYVLNSLQDADALLLDAAYDATNKVLVRHHIERFYLRNPSGELHIMIVDQGTSMEDMMDKTEPYAKKMLKDANGRIKLLGCVLNEDDSYTSVTTGGIDADALAASAKAQELYEDELLEFRTCQFFIEGRELAVNLTNAPDLRALSYPNVSMVVMQDPTIADLEDEYEYYAAVGDVIGIASVAAVSQNIGELGEFNLTNVAQDVFLNAALSSGVLVGSIAQSSLVSLDTKGYIFAVPVSGLSGFFINDSHTMTSLASDYAYLENNRTIDKAITLARLALLPRVKSRFLVDPDSGEIEATQRKSLEALAESSLDVMVNDGDISGGVEAYIPPGQNILSTSKFELQLTFIPVSIGREITIKVGFSNPSA